MQKFIEKHRSQVVGVLSGWDRVRFRGSFRVLSVVAGLFTWLHEQKVLLKEFKGFALSLTARLKESVESVAASAGRKIQYLASSALSKEALVEELLRREQIEQGLVCVFSCVEPCRSFDIHCDSDKKLIDLVSSLRKCLHWYLYFMHPVWGLCHIRIQSWLPFTVHVCINGRESSSRSLAVREPTILRCHGGRRCSSTALPDGRTAGATNRDERGSCPWITPIDRHRCSIGRTSATSRVHDQRI